MIAIGVAFVCGGIVILGTSPANPVTIDEGPTSGGSRQVPSHAFSLPEPDAPPSLTPEEKGRSFEEWVVRRFNPAYFTIKEWRGDKHTGYIYAESSTLPDLEIEFRLKGERALFAVECKWRQRFRDGERPGIEWAGQDQIARYRQFQRDRGIPVFIAIGVGGTPDNPEDVYVTSLERLQLPFAHAEYLAKFRRQKRAANFYFDPGKGELR
jgi:hypothetical protein